MKRFWILPAFVVCFVTGCSNSSNKSANDLYSIKEVNAGPVVVTINDQEIHQGLLDVLAKMNPRIKSQLDNPITRKKLLGSLVDQQLLFQEAVKRNMDKNDDLIVKAMLNKHVLISNALVEEELNASVKKAYEERKNTQFSKLKVSLISALFNPNADNKKDKPKIDRKPTDAEKNVALEKIKKAKDRVSKGEAFDVVAKELSDDKSSKTKGGDAGQIARDDKRFARLGLSKLTEAAFSIKKDQVSDVVEGNDGYYIVKVTGDPVIVPFEEAERILKFEMQNTIKTKIIDDLKSKAKIAYNTAEDKTEVVPATKPDTTLPVTGEDKNKPGDTSMMKGDQTKN